MFKPIFKKNTDESTPRLILPVIPLRDIVVFPFMIVPLFVGRTRSVTALAAAMNQGKNIFLVSQKKVNIEEPKESDLYHIGTIGKILQLLKLPDGTVKAMIQGQQRARVVQFIPSEEFTKSELDPINNEIEQPTPELLALCKTIIEMVHKYAKINKSIPPELIKMIADIKDPNQLADTISGQFAFKHEEKQKILETIGVIDRLKIVLEQLKAAVEIFEVEKKIKGRIKDQMDKTQRNYYLNEQIRAIRKEMGAEEDPQEDIKDLELRLKRKRMTKEANNKARQEFKKLKMMAPMSPEATVVRNYIEWFIELPWFNYSKVNINIDQAETILNEDHYGLEKPKERILEFLAVQSLVKKQRGPILCLVGPPGVGKTSLAKSVARATGREFVRLSLGGVRDEAEIRGHRRTYIGAMPGKIIQSLKKVKVNNPVFCLDEVDKMSMDFRGDPSSALLEVLDPEQNNTFNDHYLDVDYDLSKIMFITTANTLPDIPLPLQDRMEIIRLAGYTELEKQQIAMQFLIPKQAEQNGLDPEKIKFDDETLLNIIRFYTKEAGVRNLEREIASVCRKIARAFVQKKNEGVTEQEISTVYPSDLQKYLGPPKYRHGQTDATNEIGLSNGLAWTQVGGEMLTVETVVMPGRGQLMITGKLGDVMKESAQAAMSYVRSRSNALGLDEKFYRKYDIHIHVPEGAIPKDGPSAGITMCTSIISALTGKPVFHYVAMTGEITLRGRVLPIGGLKEKILAAHRAEITHVIIPKDNEKDLKDIPDIILKQITIILVEHMDDVLKHALLKKEDIESFNAEKKEVAPPASDVNGQNHSPTTNEKNNNSSVIIDCTQTENFDK